MNIVEATEVAELVVEVNELEAILNKLRDDDKNGDYDPEHHYGVPAKSLSIPIKAALKTAKQEIAQFKVGSND